MKLNCKLIYSDLSVIKLLNKQTSDSLDWHTFSTVSLVQSWSPSGLCAQLFSFQTAHH